MNGFIISCIKNENYHSDESLFNIHVIGDYTYSIVQKNCNVSILKDGNLLIIDGYTFPSNFSAVASAICSKKYFMLNEIEGHFSGIYINARGIVGFNDRYGGKTLCWQLHNKQLIISSRIGLMPIYDTLLDKYGVFECLRYRWTTGSHTLLAHVKKLIAHHIIEFKHQKPTEQFSYWSFPSPKINKKSLEYKVEQTKALLEDKLKQASKRYKKVAIFLSGGVDSSILAALSKNIFEECYLITPIFDEGCNPELSTAIEFAKQLNLPHHLVKIKHCELEKHLKQLLSLKREPLRHYSSLAMMVMMASIPEDIDAVIYGEAADTLFGSNSIKKVLTYYRWKKYSQYIPVILLNLLKKIAPNKSATLLTFKNNSLRELLLSVTTIKYSPLEMLFINKLSNDPLIEIEHWLWNKKTSEVSTFSLRKDAQERILNSDAVTHFSEAEIIAEIYNKHIISPFFAPNIIKLSTTLNNDDYLGTDYVKPVLRELACQFFPRELIYQKKHGFPVPFVAWLNEPLKKLVNDIKNERVLFNGSLLNDMSIEQHYEIFWLLINWQIINNHFDKIKIR